MKNIAGISIFMGFLFGFIAFIIIFAINDSVDFAIMIGVLAGVLFGGVLAVCLVILYTSTNKKYLKYKNEHISEHVVYEASFFRLNGGEKDSGQLFLTDKSLFIVIIRGNTTFRELVIPLASIEKVFKKYDYGHLANALIIQKDGTETRFISDFEKLVNSLRPYVSEDVCV